MNCMQNIGVTMISCSILFEGFDVFLFISTKVMLFFQLAKFILLITLIFHIFSIFSFMELHFEVEMERIM